MRRVLKHSKEISRLLVVLSLFDASAAFAGGWGPSGSHGGGDGGSTAQNNTNQIIFNGPVSVSGGHNNVTMKSGPQLGGSQESTITNQGSVNSFSSGGAQNLVGAQQAKNTGSGQIIQGGSVRNYLNIYKY
jgi:hypothetical protein